MSSIDAATTCFYQMSLKILGQYKGFIDLDLNTATVRHLKEAVSQASGLEVAGLKLLAGEVDALPMLSLSDNVEI